MIDDLHRTWRSSWRLDPEVAFCNHGSFGATPVAVLQAQARLRDELESDPVRFVARRLEPLLDEARRRLAEFVGTDPEGLVFVPNATTGVNTVLRSLPIAAGDDILVTDHGYEACTITAERVAEMAGARVVTATLPTPVRDPDQILDAVVAAVTPRTRIAVIDHITSPTALVLPIAEIVAALSDRGIDVVVDGAHGPGQVPLDVAAIGAAAYSGNCHKWLCAPKGAGFLWLRDDLRETVAPLVTSHGERHRRPGRSRLHDRFDWVGTADPTPYLAVPAAIDAIAGLIPGGWRAAMERNHRLAIAGARLLEDAGPTPIAADAMFGSMAALRLGAPVAPGRAREAAIRLTARLYDEHRVQAPVTWRRGSGELAIRLSAHLHTGLDDLERLAKAVAAIG